MLAGITSRSDALRLRRGTDGRDRAIHNLRELEWLNVQPEFAAGDPGDVQDVIDNLFEAMGVPHQDRHAVRESIAREHAGVQHLCVAEDCVERRAQFVRERSQKVVLDAICLRQA